MRKTAQHISSYFDIYKAAFDLTDPMLAYFPLSRLAFSEICLTIIEDKEIVSKVIDKYVMSPQVDQYIINNPCFDAKMRFDFIEHDCGDFYNFIHRIKEDIETLKVLAHPLDYNEERVYQATHAISERVEPTPENTKATECCIETLKKKRQQRDMSQEQPKGQPQDSQEQPKDQPQEQPKDQPQEQPQELPSPQSEVQVENKQSKYTICNEDLLHSILKYLHSTEVLDETVNVQTFFTAVEKADISGIRPILKEKFWSSLSPTQVCIKSKRAQWLRDVCASINIVPKEASKNNTNNKEWYEKFKELVAKGSKK